MSKKNSALIVIDVQNYFLNQHTKHLPKKIANFILKNNKKNNSKFYHVLFTTFVNSKSSNFHKFFGWIKCNSSPDTDIAHELSKFANSKNIFAKHTFSAFKSKKLLAFLRKNRVSEVHLCGTDSDACVLASAYDAFDLGFSVHVIKELCASCNNKRFDKIGKAIIARNLEKRPI